MRITIPNFLYEETPILAGVCEMINCVLAENPNMSLKEFAKGIDEANKETAKERLEKAIEKQIGGAE